MRTRLRFTLRVSMRMIRRLCKDEMISGTSACGVQAHQSKRAPVSSCTYQHLARYCYRKLLQTHTPRTQLPQGVPADESCVHSKNSKRFRLLLRERCKKTIKIDACASILLANEAQVHEWGASRDTPYPLAEICRVIHGVDDAVPNNERTQMVETRGYRGRSKLLMKASGESSPAKEADAPSSNVSRGV